MSGPIPGGRIKRANSPATVGRKPANTDSRKSVGRLGSKYVIERDGLYLQADGRWVDSIKQARTFVDYPKVIAVVTIYSGAHVRNITEDGMKIVLRMGCAGKKNSRYRQDIING